MIIRRLISAGMRTRSPWPQIGPHYAKLDGRNDYRSYAYYTDGKRQEPGVSMET